MSASAAEAIDELIRHPPAIHHTEAGPQNWSLGPEPLRWLDERVQPGWRTIETGCGHSSILFALKGAQHTIVAPAAHEHQAIRDWCEERGFSTDNLTSIVSHSEWALPGLPDDPFDLALIDGAHAFPIPFIDWYYLASRLKDGGYLIVDDVHLKTGRILVEFLAADDGRWAVEAEFDTTVVLRRTGGPVVPETDWAGQPWSVEPPPPGQRLRRALRPRTRIRALLGTRKPPAP